MTKTTKRGLFVIYNADNEIVKMYKNFKCAYNAINKLALSGEYFQLVEIKEMEVEEICCC